MKAIERESAGYPQPLARIVPTVPDSEFVSQTEAAPTLDVSLWRVGSLVYVKRLDPVHDTNGRAGVSRTSLQREFQRRKGAGCLRRAWMLLVDIGRALVRSV